MTSLTSSIVLKTLPPGLVANLKFIVQHTVKNVFDIGGSTILLLLLSPLFLLIAIAIKIESRGPVFFRHERVGKNSKPFMVWKFRTMIRDADKTGPNLTSHGDPRITGVGRILRRLSLDELPQLFNVVRGEMSLVGPRPEIPDIVARYTPTQKRALSVKPGITGLSQINGRDDLPINKKLGYELEYVENFSLLLDFKILLKTIPALLSGEGNRF